MAELTNREKLQPSLLDRLTDHEPEQAVESRERRVLSPAQLRESVRRDLAHLFNTTHLNAVESLDDYPHVQRSVLNFGIADLSGRSVSGMNTGALEAMLTESIWNYEPRLIKETVRVRLDEAHGAPNTLSFVIEAQLWAQPLPLQLFLRTEVDLEDGHVMLQEADAVRKA
jgi:type VI secretion system protein ImpF